MANGEKFTADNPMPKPGKGTDASWRPIPDEWFANESDPAAVLKSERMSAKEIDKEEEAIDELLEGDDSAFDELNY